MTIRHLFTTFLSLLLATLTVAQESVGIALYNLDKLYDTSLSPFYDDSPYTPSGRMLWSEERYQRKIKQVAQVIDSMELPIVVLYGVESREVVRDIQRLSRLDYSSHHRSLDYYDGLDFALLYYGDMLQIEEVGGNNFYSYFRGELLGQSITFHLTRRGDRLHSLGVSSKNSTDDITIVWGRLNRRDLTRLSLEDPLQEHERLGRGDTYGSRGWYFNHRIGIKTSQRVAMSRAGVVISPYLLSTDRTQPLATYSYEGYLGGVSSHLPHYIFFTLKD